MYVSTYSIREFLDNIIHRGFQASVLGLELGILSLKVHVASVLSRNEETEMTVRLGIVKQLGTHAVRHHKL